MNTSLRDTVIAALTAVAPEADASDLDPTAQLTEELDLDSMDFLNVVTELSERLGVDIPERDYPRLSTLEGAVAYLEQAGAGVTT